MSIMTFRTKIILLAIAVITAATTIFAAMYKPKRSNTIVRPIVKIIAELPLSGSESHIGLAARQAIQNALHQADSSTGYKYEVSYIDLQQSNSFSSRAKAVLRFDIAPTPKIHLTINDEDKTTFLVQSSYQETINQLQKIIHSANVKNIGLIILSEGNYKQLAQQLNQYLSTKYNLRGAVFQKGQQNFNSIANMLINNDTEFYIIIGSPTESDKLVQTLHEKGVSNYQISSLHTPDLTSQPSLYEGMNYVGSEAGIYDGGLSAAAILALIDSYEKNFKKDLLPNSKLISQTLYKKAPDKYIKIKSAIKKISEGKISTQKE